jgi:hypothetical protein
VVENLVQFLDFETLKNARLVCTKWSSYSIPVFRKKAKMFAKLDIIERPVAEFEEVFSTEVDSAERFTALELEMPDYLKYFVSREWLVDYGKNLTHIKVGHTWENPDDQDHDLLFPRSTDLRKLLRTCCPNLKEFIIPVPFLDLDTDSSFIPLEERYVELDHLEIGMNHDFDFIDPEFGELLEEVFSSIRGVKSLKLVN